MQPCRRLMAPVTLRLVRGVSSISRNGRAIIAPCFFSARAKALAAGVVLPHEELPPPTSLVACGSVTAPTNDATTRCCTG